MTVFLRDLLELGMVVLGLAGDFFVGRPVRVRTFTLNFFARFLKLSNSL